MARTKSREKAPAEFVLKQPSNNAPKSVSKSGLSENGSIMASYLDQLRKGIFMPKVNNNKELLERIDEYFNVCASSETPPTVAGMCLYCGYSHYAFPEWRAGKRSLPSVPGYPSTAEIAKSAASVLLGLNESMAIEGKLNPVTYIFTSCNYFGLQQKNTV